MSVCRKLPDGTIQKIAGHTILLDANASEVREGQVSFTNPTWGSFVDVTFSDPMPDTDYKVILEYPYTGQNWVAGSTPADVAVDNKTTTGFRMVMWPVGTVNQVYINWTAFKPVKIEGYTELQNKVNNPDNTPTIDSMNLVTSDGVARAIVLYKNVESAAGVTTATLREFVEGMLEDIAMQNWENGTYAGKLQSTHAGIGDFGSWVGSYQCTKSHSGQYGTTVFGVANGKGFTAIWAGGTTGWHVKLCGRQQKFDEWTDLGTYEGSSLTIPANSASWIKIVGAYIDPARDTFVPRFFGDDIVVTGWSIDLADNTLIVRCHNISAVDITLSKVWFTVIMN